MNTHDIEGVVISEFGLKVDGIIAENTANQSNDDGCKGTRGHCASAIKTKPAKPKKRSAEKGHGEVVGRHGLVTIAFSFPHNKCGGKGCDTQADMTEQTPSNI